MKNRIQLLIIPIIMIFTMACSISLNAYEFLFNNDNVGEKDREILADDEEKYGFKVEDPADSPTFEPTAAEKNIQGIHSYRIEGYNNIAFGGNEWVTTGQAEVLFDKDGVKYRHIESGIPLQSIERTSENHYQQVDEHGCTNKLRVWDEGFEYETISDTGTTIRLTFYLDE